MSDTPSISTVIDRANEDHASEFRQLVIFELSGEEYALPIECVQEIIRYTEPRSVSSHDPSIRGVINLRGNIVPVYDLRHRLGLGDGLAEQAKIVVADVDNATAGIVVDEVTEVLTVEVATFEDLPSADGETIEGIIKLNDRLIVLLNVHRVIAWEDGKTVLEGLSERPAPE